MKNNQGSRSCTEQNVHPRIYDVSSRKECFPLLTVKVHVEPRVWDRRWSTSRNIAQTTTEWVCLSESWKNWTWGTGSGFFMIFHGLSIKNRAIQESKNADWLSNTSGPRPVCQVLPSCWVHPLPSRCGTPSFHDGLHRQGLLPRFKA